MLSCNQRLDDHIIDLGPKQVHVDSDLLKMLAESCQSPLVPVVISVNAFIGYILCVLLVDRVVCKMNKFVLLVFRSCVVFSGESCETFLEHIHS